MCGESPRGDDDDDDDDDDEEEARANELVCLCVCVYNTRDVYITRSARENFPIFSTPRYGMSGRFRALCVSVWKDPATPRDYNFKFEFHLSRGKLHTCPWEEMEEV